MTNASTHMSLQEMLKAAQAGSLSRAKLAAEAAKQSDHDDEKCSKEKTSSVSTDYVMKIADALEYIGYELGKEAEGGTTNGPGAGPGHLEVTQATASTPLPDHKGQATPKNIVPMHTPTEKGAPTAPKNALETNDHSPPGAGGHTPEKVAAANLKRLLKLANVLGMAGRVGGVGGAGSLLSRVKLPPKGIGELMHNATHAAAPVVSRGPVKVPGMLEHAHAGLEASKMRGAVGNAALKGHEALTGASNAVRGAVSGAAEKAKGFFGGLGAKLKDSFSGGGGGKMVTASDHSASALYMANLSRLGIKLAEDAINPAHISAGPAEAPKATEAGQDGGEPVGGAPKGPTSLIGSNESAINFTRGQAYANRKADMKQWLSEPMDSAAHDNTLQVAFSHTSEAGPKVASAGNTKTAAARALFQKLVEEVN